MCVELGFADRFFQRREVFLSDLSLHFGHYPLLLRLMPQLVSKLLELCSFVFMMDRFLPLNKAEGKREDGDGRQGNECNVLFHKMFCTLTDAR